MSEQPSPEIWSARGFVEHFGNVHRKMPDRRFAFVLGAGASVQSGIPAAGTLVQLWLGELHRRLAPRGATLERWATAAALGIPGFEFARATEFYSQVFERRFRQHPDEGYADLETIMHRKDPSFGYSVLAQILSETQHKLVITTNFDNLVADALSIFTDTSPLVCGHESLAQFIRVHPRRPVVVKIHRDLLMEPMNQTREIEALRDAWKEPLTRIFRNYTPLVIGYGGNDGSLMGFLNELPPRSIVGGIFWCYWAPAGPPAPAIQELVARHGGALVPIQGFDELMLLLSAELKFTFLDRIIEQKAQLRLENYRNRLTQLTDLVTEQPADEAAVEPLPGEPDGASAATSGEFPSPPEPAAPVLQSPPPSTPPAASAPVDVREQQSPDAPQREVPGASSDRAPALSRRSDEAADDAVREPTTPRTRTGSRADALRARFPSAAGSPPPATRGAANPSRERAEPGAAGPLGTDGAAPGTATVDLKSALREVARATMVDSAASALARARAEPEPARALEMLRVAVRQFPGDIELSRLFADRLCQTPSPKAVLEALSALSQVSGHLPSFKAWLVVRDRALLRALRGETKVAREELREGLEMFEWISDAPDHIGFLLHFTLAAGLVACLDGRDDTPALAMFKAVPGANVTERAPNLIAAAVERLDRPRARLYGQLYDSVSGDLSRADIEGLEPRFRKIMPAPLDWTALDRLL